MHRGQGASPCTTAHTLGGLDDRQEGIRWSGGKADPQASKNARRSWQAARKVPAVWGCSRLPATVSASESGPIPGDVHGNQGRAAWQRSREQRRSLGPEEPGSAGVPGSGSAAVRRPGGRAADGVELDAGEAEMPCVCRASAIVMPTDFERRIVLPMSVSCPSASSEAGLIAANADGCIKDSVYPVEAERGEVHGETSRGEMSRMGRETAECRRAAVIPLWGKNCKADRRRLRQSRQAAMAAPAPARVWLVWSLQDRRDGDRSGIRDGGVAVGRAARVSKRAARRGSSSGTAEV